ncbi:MAG: cysteine--tRNA ligase [Parvularculaceae bacterium]
MPLHLDNLHLHNTLSRAKEPFAPADPKRVTMYVCGPTVYNYAHIGNARPVVVFDVLYRLLRRIYGAAHVVYARNFTDIDDKIIEASLKSGEPIETITDKFAEIYKSDMKALGALDPDLEPRATGHIPEMIALIGKLIEQGCAYVAEGHVLFDTAKFADYGALSRLNREQIIEGARVEVAPYKRDAADFVLWKPSRHDMPGWETPAEWGLKGRGRPGWHLECSAMIEKNLGITIDIHGGGQDLRFPHHENEIAQSACAHSGAPLARFWLHNGFVQMGEEKMSKSLGNVLLVHELLPRLGVRIDVVRWALLSAHYRQPLKWTDELIEQTTKRVGAFYQCLKDFADVSVDPDAEPEEAVVAALKDDLNTPEAFKALGEAKDRLRSASVGDRAAAKSALLAGADLLGVLYADPDAWLKGEGDAAHPGARGGAEALSADGIETLIAERAAAKKAKDFARADEIRDALKAQGVVLEDRPDGTTDWRRA